MAVHCSVCSSWLCISIPVKAKKLTLCAGSAMLLHWLAEWGCPPGLLLQLGAASVMDADDASSASASDGTAGGTISSSGGNSSSSSSRVCLLALAWLVAHARLFDRALQHLQLPPALVELLPPYPQVRLGGWVAALMYASVFVRARRKVDWLLLYIPACAMSLSWRRRGCHVLCI
jgi:hypothetical protein